MSSGFKIENKLVRLSLRPSDREICEEIGGTIKVIESLDLTRLKCQREQSETGRAIREAMLRRGNDLPGIDSAFAILEVLNTLEVAPQLWRANMQGRNLVDGNIRHGTHVFAFLGTIIKRGDVDYVIGIKYSQTEMVWKIYLLKIDVKWACDVVLVRKKTVTKPRK